MELEGKVIQDLPMQEGISKAGNPWKKKEWIVETLGNFPRKVKIQAFGDRATSINLQIGMVYRLSVDAESREFNGRWYTDISVYAASPMQADPAGAYGAPYDPGMAAPAGPQFAQPGFGAAPVAPAAPAASAEDDLPF